MGGSAAAAARRPGAAATNVVEQRFERRQVDRLDQMVIEAGLATDVYALRVNFVGALGWELHFPIEYANGLFEQIFAAGAEYGIGMAGVQMGWMLGPVSLAPSPDRVPQYVAIHTTLVGIRGVIFQGLGMLLYKLSGDFHWPFALAAGAFLWAAIQMYRLQGDPRTELGRVASER